MPPDDRLDELVSLWRAADERGEPVDLESLCRDAPELLPELRQRIEFADKVAALAADLGPPTPLVTGPTRDDSPTPVTIDLSDTNPVPGLAREPLRPPAELPPGYEHVRELGRGGMGVVVLARQTAADRLVALKMLLAGPWAGAEERARFRAEARAVAGIAHPNVVAVYDVGEHAGFPFFSMEYCPGGSLRDRIRGEPLTPRAAAALVREVASGVAAAHARDIVHRDLKPQNILLTGDPGYGTAGTHASPPSHSSVPPLAVPKVTDFGLAKAGGDDRLTTTGSVLGTPAYMAPEQARGDSRKVGPPADVWALGAILYECLTGRPPFQGSSVLETLDLVRTADPVGPRLLNPAIPRDLETVCLKCLRKEAAHRYPTAAALAADLDRFLDGCPILARPVGRVEKVWKWTRRNPSEAGLLAALTAVIVVALGTTTYQWQQARDRERDAHEQRELAEANRVRAEQSEATARTALGEATAAQARAAAGERRARTEATRAESVAGFLGGLFEASDPLQISGAATAVPRLRGEQLTAREMLLRGAQELDRRTDLDPDTRATLALRIGNSFLTIGDFPNAAVYLGQARAGMEKQLAADDPDRAEVYHALAWLEQLRGNYDESEDLYRRALALQEKADLSDPPNAVLLSASRIKLGILLAETGDTAQGARLVEQARVRRAELAKADPRYNRLLGEAYLAAAVVAAEDGGLKSLLKAKAYSERGIELLLGRGDDPLARAIRLFHEGLVLAYVQKKPREAVGKLTESLAVTRKVLGDRHLYAIIILGQLAFVYDDFQDDAAAERMFLECLAMGREQGLATHPKAGMAIVRLARLFARTYRPAAARSVITNWLADHESESPDGLKHADALTDAAAILTELGDEAAAVKALERAEAAYQAKLKTTRRLGYVWNQQYLGAAYARQKKWAAAEPRFAAALTAMDEHFPEDRTDGNYFQTLAGWSQALAGQGKYPTEVESRLTDARTALAKLGATADRIALRTTLAVRLSEHFRGRGEPAKALRTTREALAEAVSGESVFAVAEELARCAGQARGPVADSLKAEAVKALRTAARRGFTDARRLRESEALRPLRDRADFQELVEELSRPKD